MSRSLTLLLLFVSLPAVTLALSIEDTWEYTTANPGPGWEQPDFKPASPWKKGQGGFGKKGTPGGRIHTDWLTSDIWLRGPHIVKEEAEIDKLALDICHDEDVEVYINGVLACKRTGYIAKYQRFPIDAAARNTLKVGANVIAVHCHQTSGGQFIDVGLVTPMQYVRKEDWQASMLALRQANRNVDAQGLYETVARDCPEQTDWFLQDAQGDVGKWNNNNTSTELEQALITRVCAELGDDGEPFLAKMQQLGDVAAMDRRWLDLYVDACEKRRATRLAPMLARWKQFIFTRHFNLGGSHYAYTEGLSDARSEKHFVPGTALCQLTFDGIYGTVTPLLEDKGGVIRDPDFSFDGQRCLFAWKKDKTLDDYHLYEMTLADRKVRQLTYGLGVADYEGIYLPNGDLLFSSTRGENSVPCFVTEVSNLWTCDGDGQFMRRLGFDQVHTNFPQVLEDGRVIYTRWEYSDRGQIYLQSLFQMNPDGTAQTEFYGNNSFFPTTIMHARGIPGTPKVVATLFGHHTPQAGKLAIIDPTRGRQENTGVQLIAPVRETEAVRIDTYGQRGELFQYPYPVTETDFIVAYNPLGWERDRKGARFGIYLMKADGRRELLTADPDISCNQAIPFASREKPPVRPSTVDYTKDWGVFTVQDIYHGPGLEGVERGTVRKLRIVALEYRAAPVGVNRSTGPGGSAHIFCPVAIGRGSWDVKKILGDARVYEDGSASFRVPARMPVYFLALDKNDRMVQIMRSWATLQPNETFSCTGCHENKNEAPVANIAETTEALKAGVQELTPFYGEPKGFSYIQEIQPIWDRHCITCHYDRSKTFKLPNDAVVQGAQPSVINSEKKAFSLLGTQSTETNDGRSSKVKWSDSYLWLTKAYHIDEGKTGYLTGVPENEIVNWVSAQSSPHMLKPYAAGSNRSRLIAMLEKGHGKANLSKEEMDKVAAWIDLLVPYCGDYKEARAWSEREYDKYDYYLNKRRYQERHERSRIEALIQARSGQRVNPYRNVALNYNASHDDAANFPYASSNSECRNEKAFYALNAIDGNIRNPGHGPAFPSWGPDKSTDLWWRVDFGHEVEIDKLALTIRADFPHDAYWHSGTIEFSDGSTHDIQIEKTLACQEFRFPARRVTWARITNLKQPEPLGWCAFTEVEFWGRDAE